MTDYTSLMSNLLSFHPLSPVSARYYDTIQEQLSTIMTSPPIPTDKLNFVTLVLALETYRLCRDHKIASGDLRVFNKPRVDGRYRIGLECSAGEKEFVVAVGLEEGRYEDAVDNFFSVVEGSGMGYMTREMEW
jgi:hypothetical protein